MPQKRSTTTRRVGFAIGVLGLLVAAGAAQASNPAVQSLDPSSAPNDGSVRVTITGVDFQTGATVQLVRAASSPCPAEASPPCSAINGTSVSVVSANQIAATFDITDAAPGTGAWDLRVTNPDTGTTPSCGGCFTITGAQPTASNTTPSSVSQGGTADVTIHGTNFAKGATVSVTGAGVSLGDTTFNASNAVTVPVTVDADAAPGPRSLTVTNTDGKSVTCACLSVSVGPRPTAADPASRGTGASNQVVTITGTGFANSAVASFALPSTAAVGSINGVTVSQTTFVSSTELRATVSVSGALPAIASAGPRDITVTNADGGAGVCLGCFTVNAPPSVSSTDPASRGSGATEQEVTVAGDKFACVSGTPFTGTVSFGSGVTVTSKQCDQAPTKLKVTIDIASGTATGTRQVTVGNPDGGAAVACPVSCFQVNAAPAPTTATPGNMAAGQSADVTLAGSNFLAGAVVRVSGDKITVTSTNPFPVAFVPAGNPTPGLLAHIVVDSDAALGTRDLIVMNPDGGRGVCAACLNLTNAAATPIRVSPAGRGQGASSATISVHGSDFLSGATVQMNLPVSALPGAVNGVTVTNAIVRSATQVDVDVAVASGATAGPRDVVVTNVNGPTPVPATSTCFGCFTVNAAPSFAPSAPPLSQPVAPSALGQGAQNMTVTVNGANFTFGAGVAFSGAGITSAFVTSNPTAITLNVSVASGAPGGARDVTVTNTDGGVATCANCFAVNAVPTVSSVNPPNRGQGASSQNVTVTGSDFISGATLSFGDGVTVSNVLVPSGTQITAQVSVDPVATPGVRQVTVTNPDGGTSGSCGCFTVNAAPALTSAAPASLGQGAVDQVVTLTGTNIVSGATAAFALPSGTLPLAINGITITQTVVTPPNRIAVTVSVDPNATAGARDITVANNDGGQTATCVGCFQVAAKPTVTSVTPAARAQGATDQTVDVGGTGFQPGATVLFSGSGVTGTVQSVTGTLISLKVTVASDATIGPRDVIVENADGGRNATPTCPTACFTVNAGPAVSSVSPSSVGQLLTKDVQIAGTNFHPGALVSFSGSGIVINNTTYTPPAPAAPTSITVNITVSDSASTGPRSVFVTNPDDAGMATAAFTVDPISGRYTALTPERLMDTRNAGGAFGVGEIRDLKVTNAGGVPATDVSAVALNVTVTQPTATGFLTVYPKGAAGPPNASNLNWFPGKTVTNLVMVKVGQGGNVSLFNAAGSAHVIVDVQGWYGIDPNGNAGRFQPLTPARILETRPASAFAAGETRELQVTGQGLVPSTGVSAVAVNVTVTQPNAGGFLTLFPEGATQPTASNLNWERGQTIPNRVIVGVGETGKINIFNANTSSTFVLVDVNGWYTDSSLPTGGPGAFHPLSPNRILDTRPPGIGGTAVKLGVGAEREVVVTGGGVPDDAKAVVLNVTVTNTEGSSFMTIYPTGATTRPEASDLNYEAGHTVPNLVIAKIGTDGKVTMFNAGGRTDVIYDVVGWYS